MGAGRPTRLSKEMIALAREYLEDTRSMSSHTLLPTVEGMALHLHVWKDSLYDWSAAGEKDDATALQREFFHVFKELQQAQANKLIQNGLAGRYNATITSLMMSKHGYVRQTDVTTNGKDLPTPILGGVSVRSDPSDAQAS